MINVSPYRHAMVPPEDDNTFYAFSWSDHVVTFIANSIDGCGDLVERVCALE